MKISTRGRYAIRMLIDIALHGGEHISVPLKDIAQRQDISRKYLEQIVPLLVQSGYLRADRGSQGGYRLMRAPNECTLKDILIHTEGSLAPVACLEEGASPCARREFCPTLPVWMGLEKVITEYLEGITLQMLIDQASHLERGKDTSRTVAG